MNVFKNAFHPTKRACGSWWKQNNPWAPPTQCPNRPITGRESKWFKAILSFSNLGHAKSSNLWLRIWGSFCKLVVRKGWGIIVWAPFYHVTKPYLNIQESQIAQLRDGKDMKLPYSFTMNTAFLNVKSSIILPTEDDKHKYIIMSLYRYRKPAFIPAKYEQKQK